MDFQTIKNKFLIYLRETAEASDISVQNLDSSDESIFSHQSEFKDFLKKEYKINDLSLTSMSVADIMKMDIVDGKIVNPLEENDDENEDVQTQSQQEEEDDSWLADFMNDLAENEEFMSVVDIDKSGEIDQKELDDFINTVKDLDGNGENVSLDDLFSSLELIKQGTFELKPLEESEQVEEKPETPEITKDKESLNNTSGSGGSNYSGGSDYSSNPTDTNAPQEKTLENMSEDELKQEKQTAQNELNENKSLLSSIADGSYSGDETLNQLKTDMDEAYKSYKESLEPEVQEELDKITSEIATAESNIAQKEVEISNQNIAVSQAETTYNSKQADYEAYKAAAEALSSQSSSDLSTEEQNDIASKKAGAIAKRDAAKADAEDAKRAWEAEEEKLKQLEDERDELKTGENGLDKLNAQKQILEEKIAQNPTSAELMNAYNDTKAKYDARKTELMSAAKESVETSQKRIGEVDLAMNNLKTKTDINENYSVSNVFRAENGMTGQFIQGKNGGLSYYLMLPEGFDPNKDQIKNAMVFLHGSGEVGRGSGIATSNFCPGSFLADSNFDGAILIPVLNKGGWSNKNVDIKIRNMIDDFKNSYKVTSNAKFSLAGASLGGSGTVTMTNKLNDIFYKYAIMSAFGGTVNPSVDQSRVRGYYAANDKPGSVNYMRGSGIKSLYSLTYQDGKNKGKGVGHGNVPKESFAIKNKDGNSDLLEWLFT